MRFPATVRALQPFRPILRLKRLPPARRGDHAPGRFQPTRYAASRFALSGSICCWRMERLIAASALSAASSVILRARAPAITVTRQRGAAFTHCAMLHTGNIGRPAAEFESKTRSAGAEREPQSLAASRPVPAGSHLGRMGQTTANGAIRSRSLASSASWKHCRQSVALTSSRRGSSPFGMCALPAVQVLVGCRPARLGSGFV